MERNIYADERIVMTLDAGGTNFVFSALQRGREIVEPVTYRSNADELQSCLKTIINGFEKIKELLPAPPAAISFAFPGPADYKRGIIGDLPNLPAFKGGGVALGPMLEDYFKLPTFIENDGNLFAYGESIAGALPFINEVLRENHIDKQYSNLLGITLGTGFGAGLVVNNTLCSGDNSAGGEIWLTRNVIKPSMFAESSVSTRAVQQNYSALAGAAETFSPEHIYEIAVGRRPGNQSAAIQAFDEMAFVIAESVCNAITLIDGIIVIGGGMAGAFSLLAPKIIEHMNGTILNLDSKPIPRLVSEVYDLENESERLKFLSQSMKEVDVPFSSRKVSYADKKRIGICKSRLGASRAIALGAYALALARLPQPLSTSVFVL